jgi:hypothetical protein
MEEDHYSKEWDEAPMPHSIFFTKIGHAIHGSYDVKRLGTPASHGCVRLSPAHAATLFAMVKRDGVTNTKVVLTGGEELTARRKVVKPPEDTAMAPQNEGWNSWPQYSQPEEAQRKYVAPTFNASPP